MRTIRITGIFRLAPDAAESYQRMRAGALPSGGINSAWRSTEGQRSIFLSRYVRSKNRFTDKGPFGDVRKYEGVWYKRVRGLPVAVPGTSKHNVGLAIDTSVGKPVFRWLEAHGAKHGWSRPIARQDPVHWEYNAAKDTARRAKAGNFAVAVRTLRGRAGPSLSARILVKRHRGDRVNVIEWVKGDGLEWGRTPDGLFFARKFLRPA